MMNLGHWWTYLIANRTYVSRTGQRKSMRGGYHGLTYQTRCLILTIDGVSELTRDGVSELERKESR